jgi:uncharacterized protein YukE
MSLLDPAAIEHLAVLVESTASRMGDIGDDAVWRATQATWQGSAADRFRSDMAERQRECHSDASELHDLARNLLGAAVSYRQELARLGSLERRIRAALVGVAGPILGAAGITSMSLPAPGSPQWDRIAHTVASLGVRF